jgi:hypothetical protein
MLHNVRKVGNRAAHTGVGTTNKARKILDQSSFLAGWFVDYYVEGTGYRESGVRPKVGKKTSRCFHQNLFDGRLPFLIAISTPILALIIVYILQLVSSFIHQVGYEARSFFLLLF